MDLSVSESGREDRFCLTELPLSARIFMMAVERTSDCHLRGIIYHLFYDHPTEFLDVADAILQMDRMMDGLQCPQRDTKRRRFGTAKHRKVSHQETKSQTKTQQPYWPPRTFLERPLGMQVFYIQVYYRQHSSWQGDVYSYKRREKRRFRSVLELLYLIQSALAEG